MFITYFIIILFLTFIFIFLSYIFYKPMHSFEKSSAYECGFQPFILNHNIMCVHFYRVSILFILFDVEIIYLFSWAQGFFTLNGTSQFSVFFFIIILLYAFFVEYKKGMLYWD